MQATDAVELETTDISSHAFDALSSLPLEGKAVESIDVVGRRGLGQAAFTIKVLCVSIAFHAATSD